MSIEIDWNLLSSVTSAESLASRFKNSLNNQLASTSRPSFLGPITVTEFEFGSIGPDLEIRDIGDLWRVFEENDAESDDEQDEAAHPLHRTGPDGPIADTYDDFGDGWEDGYRGQDDEETGSVYSGLLSPRVAMNRMGAGIGLGAGMGVNLGGGWFNPSMHSNSRSHSYRGGKRSGVRGNNFRHHRPSYDEKNRSFSHTPPLTAQFEHQSDYGYGNLDPPPEAPLPSLQILARLDHQPNIRLTLLTSLQINYPAQMFMTLPLKLRITGFTLSADLVIAFNGPKKRLHVCIIDENDPLTPSPSLSHTQTATQSPDYSQPSTPGPGPGLMMQSLYPINHIPHNNVDAGTAYRSRGYSQSTHAEPAKPIGHRLLPSLHIESEIGQADVHALRNVGKVETFILDLMRKTLVDELVFPNYQTVAM